MKLWKRIAAAMSIMLTVSILAGTSIITALADVDNEAEEEETSAVILDAPDKAWWSSFTVARWKSVKEANQYQVKLFEYGGLESAVITVKVSSVYYDFSEVMQDGKEYYFMVRSIPKVSEQQIKAASTWVVSEEGEAVILGNTQGKWRYYLEGRQYEKEDGTISTGWLMIQGNWYFFSENGYAVTNTWMDWEDSRYFMNEDGSVRTGWMEWEGNWYYFDKDGRMLTGWINGSSPTERYYLNPDGTMAYDTEVDGYVLDSNGLAAEAEQ